MRRRAIDTPLFNLSFGIYLVFKAHALSSGLATHRLIDGYLADVLALPVVLSWCEDLLALREGPAYRLSLPMVVFAWGYTSFMMEWVAPRINENAVADGYDVLAYGLGAMLYVAFRR